MRNLTINMNAFMFA